MFWYFTGSLSYTGSITPQTGFQALSAAAPSPGTVSLPYTASLNNIPIPNAAALPGPPTLSNSLPPAVMPHPGVLPQPTGYLQPPGSVPPLHMTSLLPPTLPQTLPPPIFTALPGFAPGMTAVPAVNAFAAVPPVPVSAPAVSKAASTGSTATSAKRRFREEKEDDKLPDDLLGYQVCVIYLN